MSSPYLKPEISGKTAEANHKSDIRIIRCGNMYLIVKPEQCGKTREVLRIIGTPVISRKASISFQYKILSPLLTVCSRPEPFT